MTENERRKILLEVVRTFGKQEWFRDAVVDDNHPMSGEPTLELKVNYVPLFNKKDVIDFAQKVNLSLRYQVVDRNGNPVQ